VILIVVSFLLQPETRRAQDFGPHAVGDPRENPRKPVVRMVTALQIHGGGGFYRQVQRLKKTSILRRIELVKTGGEASARGDQRGRLQSARSNGGARSLVARPGGVLKERRGFLDLPRAQGEPCVENCLSCRLAGTGSPSERARW
jgi:hypothetical protein